MMTRKLSALLDMRTHLFRLFCASVVMLAPAVTTLAADDDKVPDARLEGFGRNVKVEGSTTGTWVLFVVLSVLCMSVLFKNAKRSHLD